MQINGDIRVRLERNYSYFGYMLYIFNGDSVLCQDGKYKPCSDTTAFPEGAGIQIPDDCLQELSNELWQHGIQPSRVKDFKGELSATQKHLEDMRTLVFKEKPTVG